MGPRLGGTQLAGKYLEFAALNIKTEKIPEAIMEITKIISPLKNYDVVRRWLYLASFLNSFHWESKQCDCEKKSEDSKGFQVTV